MGGLTGCPTCTKSIPLPPTGLQSGWVGESIISLPYRPRLLLKATFLKAETKPISGATGCLLAEFTRAT